MSTATPPTGPGGPSFAIVRRGYDPDAVDRHVNLLLEQAAAGGPTEAEARARADELVSEAREEADRLLHEAQAIRAEARSEIAHAGEVRREAEIEVERLAQAATDAAEQVVASARERAEAIVGAAEAIDADLQANRWADVGDRVARILAAGEHEAADMLAQSVAKGDQISASATAAAEAVQNDADRYAEETRALADEWAHARMASAEADQSKAAEVLDAARERANRVVADAEREAREIHERASADVTAHVQELLASARYDLNQLETRADAARSHLQELRDLAARSLGPDVARPSSSLGSADAFLTSRHIYEVPSADHDHDELDAPGLASDGAAS